MERKKFFLKTGIGLLIFAAGLSLMILREELKLDGFDTKVFLMPVLGELILILLIFLANLIVMKWYQNRRINTDLLETRIFEKKKFAEEHFLKYYKKVSRHILLSDLYILFLSILQISLFTFLCLLLDAELFYIILLMGTFLFYSFSFIIGKDQIKPLNNDVLSEKDYPKLWEMIRKIARDFSVKKPLRCYVTYDNNAGVGETDKFCYILLGAQLVPLLSEEELENVLIHEFAHIYLDHTNNSNKLVRRLGKWKNLIEEETGKLQKFFRVLYYTISAILLTDYDIFNLVSTRTVETEADKLVIKKGNKQIYINALAKLNLYNLFQYDEGYPINVVYENEKIAEDYFFIMFKKFFEYYQIHRELWHSVILKRIPARIDSHYPLKYRMDLVGVDHFEISFSNSIFEADKIVSFASQLIKNDYKSEYEKDRKAKYLEPLQLIDEYEKDPANLDSMKLYKCASAYRRFGKLPEARKIYDQFLAENENNPKVLYSKGTLLLSLYDASGIDLIYKAMALNTNLMELGIPSISEYCLKMGLEEELEKSRTYLREHRDFLINVQSRIGVNVKDKFIPTALDEATIKEIIDSLKKDNRISRIYMVDKIMRKTYRMTVVGVLIKQEFLEQSDEILEFIDDYLDNDRRESFFMLSINHYPRFYKKFIEIPFSLKYQNKAEIPFQISIPSKD